mmetsp:Transcript_16896/g.50444  ORF Transcript_16896/g.50444 Transcript_16896/m.50444 type:complete len:388 (-) Transcript_16896:926-2089(-)
MLSDYEAVTGHTGSIYGVAVNACSPHLLATASDDETVRLWERREGPNAWQQAGRMATGDSAMCVTFSPDGSMLAAGAADGIASLYKVRGDSSSDTPSGLALMRHLRAQPEAGAETDEVYGCEWVTGQDSQLCTTNGTGLLLWDIEAGSHLQDCTPPAVADDTISEAMPETWREGFIFSLRQQPEGSALLAGTCSDGALRVWAGGPGQLEALWGLRVHQEMGSACCFSSDGLQLASISKDGHIVVVDVRQRRVLAAARAPAPLHGCCLLPDGSLGMAGADGLLLSALFDDLPGAAEMAPSRDTKAAGKAFCIAAGGEGGPVIVGGEALVVEQPAAHSTPEADPLFAPPTLMSSGTGARVLFTTAELDHNNPTTFKAATLHVWNRLESS